MGRVPKALPLLCPERQERLDEIQASSKFLGAAIKALRSALLLHDPAELASLREEARAIREHLAFLREGYLRHREEHGC
jgi:hypothetical protein